MSLCNISILLISVTTLFVQTGSIRRPNDRSPAISGYQSASNENITIQRDSLIETLIDQTNIDTLIYFVKILSGEDSVIINDKKYLLLSRNPLHPHNDLAADFLFQTLSRFGLTTCNQSYSLLGRNVYGVKTGTDYPDQKFIICAHYDCSPAQPPAPGADDNASGCAAVLETARILSGVQTPYTLIFAFWDEEEIGKFGSVCFAQKANQNGDHILGVLNLEMFGWDHNNDGLIDIHTRPVSGSIELANLVKSLAKKYTLGLNPVIYNPGTTESDHGSFWKYGYSALVFSEAFYGNDFNPYYQTSQDKLAHFNLSYFHALSKLALATISHLAFESLSNIINNQQLLPLPASMLVQNYPNPFNRITVISYQLKVASYVELSIYNILGQKVSTLVSKKQPAGLYQVEWDATGFAGGVYFYKMSAGRGVTQTKKLILMR